MPQLRNVYSWAALAALILFGLISPAPVAGQTANSPEVEMIAYIEGKLDEEMDSFRFQNLNFEEGEESNIYLTLINEIAINSTRRAKENLIIDRGIAEADLDNIIAAVDTANEIYRQYQDELALQRMLAKSQNQTLALEIFANSQTSDSEFDLIDDLNQIEKILFERTSQTQLTDPANTSTRIVSKPDDCDKIFCFLRQDIYKTETSFFPDDENCVACVVEEIANSMTELMAGDLTPHKVTGNFGEPTICKLSFGENIISMRINLLERPIIPIDPSTQVTELDPEELAEDRAAHVAGVSETVAQRFLNLGLAATAPNLSATVAEEASRVREQNFRESGLFAVSADVAAESALVQDIHQRMDAMKTYFESIKDMFADMKLTLEEINQKPVCAAL